jgi:hypothetical protein
MNTTSHRLVAGVGAVLVALSPAAAAAPTAADPGGADPWADESPGTVRTVSADFSGDLVGVTVSPDGTVYVAERDPEGSMTADRVVTVTPSGETTTVAGGPGAGHPFGPVRGIADVESASDGSLYVAISYGPVLRIDSDGTSTVVARAGQGPGDVPASSGTALAVALDGTIYIGARGRVFELLRGGPLTLFSAYDGPSTALERLAAADTGDVFVNSYGSHQVYRLDSNGVVQHFAGRGLNYWEPGDVGDGGPAIEADVPGPRDVAVDSGGLVYLSDLIGLREVDPDGTIRTVFEDDALEPDRIALDPYGNLYFTDAKTSQLKVLVRPGEMPDPTEYTPGVVSRWAGAGVAAIVAWGLGVVAVTAAAVVSVRERRRPAVDGPAPVSPRT